MRLLALDLGNTRAKVALYAGDGTRQEVHNLPTGGSLPEQVNEMVRSFAPDFLAWANVQLPELAHLMQQVRMPRDAVFEITGSSPTPFPVAYHTRETLGADRLAAIAGAWGEQQARKQEGPLLVIDIGTAITYDLMDAQGTYLGGAISPGIQLRYVSLHRQTARLPLVNPTENPRVLGQDTQGAIQAGVQGGMLAELEHMATLYQQQVSQPLTFFITGGDAPHFENLLSYPNFVRPHLVLDGLHQLALHRVHA